MNLLLKLDFTILVLCLFCYSSHLKRFMICQCLGTHGHLFNLCWGRCETREEKAETVRAVAQMQAEASTKEIPRMMVEDWRRMGWFGERDDLPTAAVYKKKNSITCAVVIEGKQINFRNNFNEDRAAGGCPSLIFSDTTWEEHEAYVNDPLWQERIEPYLKQCCCVIVSGHNLGGAVADIMATCSQKNPSYYPFKVHGLYTFGAPKAIRTDSGRDDRTCVPGFRFVTLDSESVLAYIGRGNDYWDPVPLQPGIYLGDELIPDPTDPKWLHAKVTLSCPSPFFFVK